MDIIVEKSTTIRIPEQPDIEAPAYGIEYIEGESHFILEVAPDSGGISIVLHLQTWKLLMDCIETHVIGRPRPPN